MKKFQDLGCPPTPWTAESDARGAMSLLCHDADEYGNPWSDDFAQTWGADAGATAKAFCAVPDLYDAARKAHAFLAYSTLTGAAEIRKSLEDALSKAGGVE